MKTCSIQTGTKVELGNKHIQVLCKDCGSEIFACFNTVKAIQAAYGKVLCAICRDKHEKLPDVRMQEIEQLIFNIEREEDSLHKLKTDLQIEYRRLKAKKEKKNG